jgi:hypothetical protein
LAPFFFPLFNPSSLENRKEAMQNRLKRTSGWVGLHCAVPALRGSELANATAGTIRQRLLKIGAMVTVSTRRVYVRLASAFPLQSLFAQAHRALAGLVAEDAVKFACCQLPSLKRRHNTPPSQREPAPISSESGIKMPKSLRQKPSRRLSEPIPRVAIFMASFQTVTIHKDHATLRRY